MQIKLLDKTIPAGLIFSMCTCLLFITCSDDLDNVTVGQDFLESEASLCMIDTFHVSLSTVLIDSLPTSSIDSLLVGNYEDNIFGRVTCNSYFEVGLPSNTEDVLDDDSFDSLTICLRYTGYSYGDTNQLIRIYFYKLLNRIELAETGYLYNTSSVSHESTPMATYTFNPRPVTGDSIELWVDDAMGLELFTMIKTSDERMETESNFLEYFKGIAIVADTNFNGSVVGFNAETDNIVLKLYGHRIGETLEELEYDFPLVYAERQFNQILHRFDNTPLEVIQSSNVAIPASEMNNKSFTQGGVGLMTKVQFPTMNEFLLYENAFVIKAELIIKPARLSYNTFELPESIYLYHTDKYNTLGSTLTDAEGYVITPEFVYDEIFEEETSYTFDITKFIRDELSDSYFDSEHGMLITFTYEEYLCSLKRIVFETAEHAAKLKLYYVHY